MSEFNARPVPVADTRPLRHAVLRPHEDLEHLAANEPEDAVAYGVFDGSTLVAVGLTGPEGERGSWRVRGMATAPGVRGRGAGAAVLDALVRHARDAGATRIWCNARTPALTFYQRAGFRPASEEFELPDIGPHVVMEQVLGPAGP